MLLSVCSVYELYSSLLTKKEQYTYDIYTVHEAEDEGTTVAVGITHGLAAVDAGGETKGKRESAFPVKLLDRGIAFKCEDGAASGEFLLSQSSPNVIAHTVQFLLTSRRSWPRSEMRANFSTTQCIVWWLLLHWSSC